MDDNRNYIGILTKEYVAYPRVLVDNIAEECASYGYGALCITGRELNPRPDFHQDYTHCTNIYQLLNNHSVKGLISLSGTIGNNIELAGLTRFVSQYNLPKVSFGIELPGIPSVTVNDSSGMKALMHHLIDETQSRRFAFIRGYQNDPYSGLREQIFRTALDEADIQVAEMCLLDGNYDALDTYTAVSNLLEAETDGIDVIVAANDLMARSAIRAIRAKGLEVPEDIIVTGFDDTEEATNHSPALTTVRQPLNEVIRLSVSLLHEQIVHFKYREYASNVFSSVHRVNSELVVRGSSVEGLTNKSVFTELNAGIISASLADALSSLRAPGNADLAHLAEALVFTLETGSGAFAEFMADQTDQSLTLDSLHWWNNLCFQLDRLIARLMDRVQTQGDSTHLHTLMVSSVIASVKEQVSKLSLDRDLEIHRLQQAQSAMQLQISSCSIQDDIIATFRRWLDNVKPKRCFLVSYREPGAKPHAQATLIYGFTQSQRVQTSTDYFDARQVLPKELQGELDAGLLVLHPAFAGEQHFGYLLLDPQGLPSIDLFQTALSIGNALRNRYLINVLEDNAKKLNTANSELEQLANYDVLTGLPNRYQFQYVLRQRSTIANQENRSLAVLFMDLDGFKSVNDSMGHNAGDHLLQHIALRLSGIVKGLNDSQFHLVARLGGDEFTLIIEGMDVDTIHQTLSAKLIKEVARPMQIEGQCVHVSASIGIALHNGPDISPDLLLRQADKAMYQAKGCGKNQSAVFTSVPSAPVEKKVA